MIRPVTSAVAAGAPAGGVGEGAAASPPPHEANAATARQHAATSFFIPKASAPRALDSSARTGAEDPLLDPAQPVQDGERRAVRTGGVDLGRHHLLVDVEPGAD